MLRSIFCDQPHLSTSGVREEVNKNAAEVGEKKIDSHKLSILDLPDVMLVHIFSFVGGDDLVLNVAEVCERFRSIIAEDFILWKNMWLTWDTKYAKRCSVSHMLNFGPFVHNIRVSHSGSLPDEALVCLLQEIFSIHKNIYAIEFMCRGTQPGYKKHVLDEVVRGSHQTLRFLSMKGPVKPDAFRSILNFSLLTSLKLCQSPNFLGGHLRELTTALPNLDWLSIPRSAFIKDDDLNFFIFHKHHVLRGLEVCGYLLTDISFKLLSRCLKLSHLSVEDARRLTWGALGSIAQLHHLRFIRFCRLRAPKGDVLKWIGCTNSALKIRVLDLRHGYDLGDDVAMLIAQKCPYIQYLYLYGFEPVTNHARVCVEGHLHNLVTSDIPSDPL